MRPKEQILAIHMNAMIVTIKQSLQYTRDEFNRQRIRCADCKPNPPKNYVTDCPKCVNNYERLIKVYKNQISQIRNKTGEFYELQVEMAEMLKGVL